LGTSYTVNSYSTSGRTRPGDDDNKLTVEELYRNWKRDTPPSKGVFSFSPPKDATKVDSLEGDSATNQKPKKNVAVFLFDRVEVIDFAGPYEVFLNASAANHSYFNVFTVAATDKAIETAGNLTIKPKYRFDNHPKIDILVLPGGGIFKSRKDPEVIKWIQKTAKDAEIVMSVCNGAGFFAKAGLLDGKEVTTTAGGIDWLQAEVPTAKVVARHGICHKNAVFRGRPWISAFADAVDRQYYIRGIPLAKAGRALKPSRRG
jgi:putative intracellular protease/amidase